MEENCDGTDDRYKYIRYLITLALISSMIMSFYNSYEALF